MREHEIIKEIRVNQLENETVKSHCLPPKTSQANNKTKKKTESKLNSGTKPWVLKQRTHDTFSSLVTVTTIV